MLVDLVLLDRFLRLFLLAASEQGRLKYVIACNFFLRQQLHAGADSVLVDELFDVVRRDGRLFVKRHDEALASIDFDLKLKIAHSELVAIEQPSRIAPANGFTSPLT